MLCIFLSKSHCKTLSPVEPWIAAAGELLLLVNALSATSNLMFTCVNGASRNISRWEHKQFRFFNFCQSAATCQRSMGVCDDGGWAIAMRRNLPTQHGKESMVGKHRSRMWVAVPTQYDWSVGLAATLHQLYKLIPISWCRYVSTKFSGLRRRASRIALANWHTMRASQGGRRTSSTLLSECRTFHRVVKIPLQPITF